MNKGTFAGQVVISAGLRGARIAARCFDLNLRAPPLEFEAPGMRPTKDHTYSLDSLSLAPGASFEQIAARLLNTDATGASLIDQDVFNGTAETIYLTVTVTKPTQVMVSQSFEIGNATTEVHHRNRPSKPSTQSSSTERLPPRGEPGNGAGGLTAKGSGWERERLQSGEVGALARTSAPTP